MLSMSFMAITDKTSEGYELLMSGEFKGINPFIRGIEKTFANDIKNADDFRNWILKFNKENYNYEGTLLRKLSAPKIGYKEFKAKIWPDEYNIYSITPAADCRCFINLSDKPVEYLTKKGAILLEPDGNPYMVVDKEGELDTWSVFTYPEKSLDWPEEEWRRFLDKLSEKEAMELSEHTDSRTLTGKWNNIFDFARDRFAALGVPDEVIPFIDIPYYVNDIINDSPETFMLSNGTVVSVSLQGRDKDFWKAPGVRIPIELEAVTSPEEEIER